MKNDIEMLLDKDRIVETINRLFIGTDNRDWPQVKSCFAPSVLFDMSSLGAGQPKRMSPDEIVAGWDAGLGPLKAIHHQAGNYLVDVTGERASAFCYGIASHYLPNETGANTRTFVGSYDFADRIEARAAVQGCTGCGFEFVRNGGQWKISGFRFNLKYLDGNPNLEKS